MITEIRTSSFKDDVHVTSYTSERMAKAVAHAITCQTQHTAIAREFETFKGMWAVELLNPVSPRTIKRLNEVALVAWSAITHYRDFA